MNQSLDNPGATVPAMHVSRLRPVDGRLPYYPGLDGIRGIALVAMLAFHSDFAWASGGYLSLPAFFVLSGFLITSLLLSEYSTAGSIRLGAFWGRRFRRLLPAALITLAGIAVFGYTVANTAQLSRLRADALSALFYVSNWRFIESGLSYESMVGSPTPVQHFWSLSVEEQFYLFFPLMVIFVLGRARGDLKPLALLLLVLTVASSCLMAYLYDPLAPLIRIYYATDTRAAEFLLGGVFAILLAPGTVNSQRPSTVLQILGALAFVLAVYIGATVSLHTEWIWRGGLMVFCSLIGLIIAACLRPGPMARIMGFYPFRELGKISYGVYLFHWPIYLWLTPERTELEPWPLFALRVTATIIPAALSYYYIEKPIRSQRSLAGNRAWWAAGASTAALVAGILFVTHNPPPPWFVIDSKYTRTPIMPGQGEGVDERPRIYVVGDSVSWSVGYGLVRWAAELDSKAAPQVWNSAIYACGIARGGEVVYAPGSAPAHPDCASWAFWWPAQLEQFQPDVVVMLTGPWDLVERKLPEWRQFRKPGDPVFDDWLVSEYLEAVDVLTASDAKLVWLTAPCTQPPAGTGGRLRGTGAFSAQMTHYINQQILPRVLAARSDKMQIIDLYSQVCPGDTLLQDVGDEEPLRPDGIHFSVPGANWLMEWLGPKLLEEVEKPVSSTSTTMAPH